MPGGRESPPHDGSAGFDGGQHSKQGHVIVIFLLWLVWIKVQLPLPLVTFCFHFKQNGVWTARSEDEEVVGVLKLRGRFSTTNRLLFFFPPTAGLTSGLYRLLCVTPSTDIFWSDPNGTLPSFGRSAATEKNKNRKTHTRLFVLFWAWAPPYILIPALPVSSDVPHHHPSPSAHYRSPRRQLRPSTKQCNVYS